MERSKEEEGDQTWQQIDVMIIGRVRWLTKRWKMERRWMSGPVVISFPIAGRSPSGDICKILQKLKLCSTFAWYSLVVGPPQPTCHWFSCQMPVMSLVTVGCKDQRGPTQKCYKSWAYRRSLERSLGWIVVCLRSMRLMERERAVKSAFNVSNIVRWKLLRGVNLRWRRNW